MVQFLTSKGWRGVAIPLMAVLFALAFYVGQVSVTPQHASATSGLSATLSAPALLAPATGTKGVTVPVALSWNAVTSATNYTLQLSTDAGFASSATVNQAVPTTSVTISYPRASTTYYWRVMAMNGGQNSNGAAPAYSSWSTVWSFTTSAPPPPPPAPSAPSAPTLLAPANSATGVTLPVALSWNAAGSATNYTVQLSQGSGFAATATICQLVKGTSLTAPPLQNNTTYYWRVQAASSTVAGSNPNTHAAPGAQTVAGAWSATWSFTTVAPPPPPAAPVAPTLLAPANGATGVTVPVQLSWNASSSATNYYMVQCSPGTDFTATATNSQLVKATTLTLPPLKFNTTYYWRVQAVGCTANGGPISATASPWSTTWSFSTAAAVAPPVAPVAPTLLAPSNGATDITPPVQLSWNAVSSATCYQVQFCPRADFAVTATNIQLAQSTALTIPAMPGNTTFYWRVAALTAGPTPAASGSMPVNTIVTGAAASPWSAVWSFTTAAPTPPTTLTAPTLLAPANGATGVAQPVQLSWNAVTGAAVYFVETGSNAAFDTNAIFGPVKDTTLILPAQSSSAPIYWRVQAVVAPPPGATNTPNGAPAGAGQFPWSAPWSFTVLAQTSSPTLTAPALLSPANAATGVSLPVTLSWNAVSGAACYEVQTSPGADFSATATAVQLVKTTSLTLPLLPGGTVYWRVAALSGVVCPVLNAPACNTPPPPLGPWSAIWSFIPSN